MSDILTQVVHVLPLALLCATVSGGLAQLVVRWFERRIPSPRARAVAFILLPLRTLVLAGLLAATNSTYTFHLASYGFNLDPLSPMLPYIQIVLASLLAPILLTGNAAGHCIEDAGRPILVLRTTVLAVLLLSGQAGFGGAHSGEFPLAKLAWRSVATLHTESLVAASLKLLLIVLVADLLFGAVHFLLIHRRTRKAEAAPPAPEAKTPPAPELDETQRIG
ncbi:MAG: hypothetical protein ACOCX4_06925 [Planctomycetota bacterium]